MKKGMNELEMRLDAVALEERTPKLTKEHVVDHTGKYTKYLLAVRFGIVVRLKEKEKLATDVGSTLNTGTLARDSVTATTEQEGTMR